MSNSKVRPALFAYVFAAAGCSFAGWFLSTLRCLDFAGYALGLMAAVGLLFIFWNQAVTGLIEERRIFSAAWRRLRRSLFPFLFAVVGLLVFIAGAANPQNFGDSNAYHIPRVLHWLHAHTWHWIPTYDNRLNTRGCVFEWMAAPLLVATGTDQFLFLINWIALLLFPGLLFQTLLFLGVVRRAAWYAAWIFPTAFGFICQAETASADFLGGFFALTALNFALASRNKFNAAWAGLALIAFALSTGTKPFNLFLGLPFCLAFLPSIKGFFSTRPMVVGVVALTMVFCSFVPNAVINTLAVNDWSGLGLEPGVFKDQTSAPIRLAFNSVTITAQNLFPPFVPLSHQLNQGIDELRSGRLGTYLSDHFEDGIFWVPPYTGVDTAALGPVLCLLLFASLIFAIRRAGASWRLDYNFWLRLSGVGSFMVLLLISTLSQLERIAIPFYPFLLAALLGLPGQGDIVRRRWWKVIALTHVGLAILFLLLNPGAPAFPAKTSLDLADRWLGKSYFLRVCEGEYQNVFPDVQAAEWQQESLPAKCQRVGLVRFWWESESVLWKPLGSREVVVIPTSATPGSLRRLGLTYAVVSQLGAGFSFDLSMPEWPEHFDSRTTSLSSADEFGWQVVAIGSDSPSAAVPPPFFKPPLR